MIPLTLGDAIAAYVIVPIVVLLFLSFCGTFWRRRNERRARRRQIQCALCGVIYVASPAEQLPRCPNCERSNERVAPSGL